MAPKPERTYKVAADNRRARYNYEIGETFEAGLMLTGTEVKSLRTGKATITAQGGTVEMLPLPFGGGRPPARGNQHTNR